MRLLTVSALQVKHKILLFDERKKIWSELFKQRGRLNQPKLYVRNAHTAEKPPMFNYGSAL